MFLRRASSILLAIIFVAVPTFPQATAAAPRYIAIKETVLSGATELITIQRPNTGQGRGVFFDKVASIYCSVACEATVYQNGTAATATSMPITVLNQSPVPTALAFSGSNSTGGALTSYYLAAGQTFPIDLSGLQMPKGSGANANVSIGVSAITGTARIQIPWYEN